MASQQNLFYMKNPDDGVTTYTNLKVYRAPDASGVAGAFVFIATVAIDASEEYTAYTDTGGEDTSWYQAKWSHPTSGVPDSNPSPSLQAGDSWVRQGLKGDIGDADVTNAMWDRWTKQTLIDLYNRGIWKPARATITITKNADSTFVERYGVAGAIRDVIDVEQVSNDAYLLHHNWLRSGEWTRDGRQVRLIAPSDTVKYVVHGKAQYASIGELTDDYFMLAYRMIRLRLLEYRLGQRSNFYRHTIYDKVSDISPSDIRAMIQDARGEISEDIKNLALPEPTVGFSFTGRL